MAKGKTVIIRPCNEAEIAMIEQIFLNRHQQTGESFLEIRDNLQQALIAICSSLEKNEGSTPLG